MNIVIIEDEAPALARLKKLVQQVEPSAVITGEADSIESAVSLFRSGAKADLAFFDIELADGRSFDIFSQAEVTCPVIFTTAYDEFALQAFKVNSIDYLLKPIEADLLKQALAKFKKLHEQKPLMPDISRLLADLRPKQDHEYKTRFLIKVGVKWISVPAEDIAYFHAADKAVFLVTHQGQRYVMDESLDQLSLRLDPKIFYHLSRQFVVAYRSIQSIHSYFNGKLKVDLTPAVNEEVTVSREKASDFKKWLDR